ncbi:hypothetical protein [Sclerotinia sclerotiorum reovirus 1]|nr:hypothetical protein [Sclerotinia sclerotiorum reovirus 1]
MSLSPTASLDLVYNSNTFSSLIISLNDPIQLVDPYNTNRDSRISAVHFSGLFSTGNYLLRTPVLGAPFAVVATKLQHNVYSADLALHANAYFRTSSATDRRKFAFVTTITHESGSTVEFLSPVYSFAPSQGFRVIIPLTFFHYAGPTTITEIHSGSYSIQTSIRGTKPDGQHFPFDEMVMNNGAWTFKTNTFTDSTVYSKLAHESSDKHYFETTIHKGRPTGDVLVFNLLVKLPLNINPNPTMSEVVIFERASYFSIVYRTVKITSLQEGVPDELQMSIATNQTSIVRLASTIDGINESLVTLGASTTALQQRLEVLSNNSTSTHSNSDSRSLAVDVQSLSTSISQIIERLASVSDTVVSQQTTLANVQRTVGSNSARLDKLRFDSTACALLMQDLLHDAESVAEVQTLPSSNLQDVVNSLVDVLRPACRKVKQLDHSITSLSPLSSTVNDQSLNLTNLGEALDRHVTDVSDSISTIRSQLAALQPVPSPQAVIDPGSLSADNLQLVNSLVKSINKFFHHVDLSSRLDIRRPFASALHQFIHGTCVIPIKTTLTSTGTSVTIKDSRVLATSCLNFVFGDILISNVLVINRIIYLDETERSFPSSNLMLSTGMAVVDEIGMNRRSPRLKLFDHSFKIPYQLTGNHSNIIFAGLLTRSDASAW